MCLACYLGLQAKDLTSKVVGMWWPIFAFVTLGLEHVVANMFFIPIGLFLGTPGLTVPLYIWKGTVFSEIRPVEWWMLTPCNQQASSPPPSATF